LIITEHPHSFESVACAVLGKPGGGVRRQLGGTPSLGWDISQRQQVCWEHRVISRARRQFWATILATIFINENKMDDYFQK
jgi:hypothetical protein